MKAAILHKLGSPLVIEDVDVADTAPGEVRIRTVASGLCHSDYGRMIGDRSCPLPALLGHEMSEIVEQVGEDVWNVGPGDAVIVGMPNCGVCPQCQAGHLQRCDAPPVRQGPPRLTLRGQAVFQFVDIGGFAEEVLVNHRSVVRIPDGVPLDVAALFSCAVITGVGAVTHCAQVQPGQSVAVIGCGGVGLNVIQGARIAGAERIFAIDLNPAKLHLARTLGATDTVLAGPSAVDEVLQASRGGVDYAFEAAGHNETVRQALLMLRKGGAVVMVGIPKSGTEIALPTDAIFRGELRVLSSVVGSVPLQTMVTSLARYYLDGRLQIEPLVAQRIGLDGINSAYEQLVRGDVVRSLVMFDAGF